MRFLFIIILFLFFFILDNVEHFTQEQNKDILYNNKEFNIYDNFTDLYKFSSFYEKPQEKITYEDQSEKVKYDTNKLDLYKEHDTAYKLDTYKDNQNSLKLKPQKYLTFLSNANEGMKKRAPLTGSFRGSCNDKVNEQYQKESLRDAYGKIDESGLLKDTFKRDPCVAYANDICEFIDPRLYLSENIYSPPHWLVKTYNTHSLPTHTDISCFNSNYTCCHSSFK